MARPRDRFSMGPGRQPSDRYNRILISPPTMVPTA